jgi:hypothetical protein
MTSKVAVDQAYLTTNLSETEREQLINGELRAIKRMRDFNAQSDRMIAEIKELHLVNKLNVEQITRLYLDATPGLGPENYFERKKEILEFITKVLADIK